MPVLVVSPGAAKCARVFRRMLGFSHRARRRHSFRPSAVGFPRRSVKPPSAAEFHQESIARCFHQPATMTGDFGLDDFSLICAEPRKCPGLVLSDETASPRHRPPISPPACALSARPSSGRRPYPGDNVGYYRNASQCEGRANLPMSAVNRAVASISCPRRLGIG